jgi:hypothetical protein
MNNGFLQMIVQVNSKVHTPWFLLQGILHSQMVAKRGGNTLVLVMEKVCTCNNLF